MVTRRLLIRIAKEIRQIMEEKGLSSRQLSEMCEKKGYKDVTRSKILRAFYVDEGRQFFLNNTDDTIEGVLDTLGYTGDDILKRILDKDNDIVNIFHQTELPQEVINFLRSKEAEPYIRLAFAQYKSDKIKKELEVLRKQLQETG